MDPSIRSIHLLGICGTGMGSFAGLLKSAGYQVRGSDENVYPPMSEKLDAWGIEVRKGYRPENLEPTPDLVIIGNVIRRTNPEAQAVLARGLSYTSFPQALGDLFLKDRQSVVVTGTHGKTTTTSLVAWLLTAAGRDPGMLVGGVPANFREGFRLGQGAHFVIEGDEYDTAFFDKVPKFLHYRPNTVVMTSLEFDHADIYENVEAIEAQFDKLLALIPSNGRVFMCAGAPRLMARSGQTSAPVETYIAEADSPVTTQVDWRARDLAFDQTGSDFTLWHHEQKVGRFRVPLVGRYNVENATAAIAVVRHLGLSVREIQDALAGFQGVARRQTVRAEIQGVRIIDDFAHHPTAVRETVSAVRTRFKEGRLFAIFEPRSATSARRYFQSAYAEAFDHADVVIIAPVGRKELDAHERLDIDTLARAITLRGGAARAGQDVDTIVRDLAKEARPKDTLLFMSNGGFGGILDKMQQALRATFIE